MYGGMGYGDSMGYLEGGWRARARCDGRRPTHLRAPRRCCCAAWTRARAAACVVRDVRRVCVLFNNPGVGLLRTRERVRLDSHFSLAFKLGVLIRIVCMRVLS